MRDDEDDRLYHVVVNREEQYSIWLADREPPAGWRRVGPGGSKPECLAYIETAWTDMRPLSLRLGMQAATHHGERSSRAVTGPQR
jgi:MbtH protein